MKRFSFVPRKRPDILCGTLQLDAFGDWVRYEDADARIVGLESALMDYKRRVKELEYGIEIGAKEWYENRCRRHEEDKKIAAKIRNLEAQLAAEREANRWIPVSERLPECTLHVVACQTPFSPFVACYVPGEGTWYDDDGIELDFIPTHWRELPAPPQEAADDK